MKLSEVVKRGLVQAFVIFGSLAVVLNLYASLQAMNEFAWGLAAGYLLIAAGIGAALGLHWYSTHRQAPYRWREKPSGTDRDAADGWDEDDSWPPGDR